MTQSNTPPHDLLESLLRLAKTKGADQAEASLSSGDSLSVSVRCGAVEDTVWSQNMAFGLRVLIGKKQAFVSSNHPAKDALEALVDQAISMAKVVPEDPYIGLADPSQIATSWKDIPHDPTTLTLPQLMALASEVEEAALGVPGVSSSEGAQASWSQSRTVRMATNGFLGAYSRSYFSIYGSVLAGSDAMMQRDDDYDSVCFFEDLKPASKIGKSAGERAVAALNPRSATPGKVPVVYENRLSGRLLNSLVGAISGAAIVQKTSFLQDALQTSVFSPAVTIIDDPFLPRGLGSRPFDAEGLPTCRTTLVDQGVLQTWLLDLRASRALGLKPTGHGSGVSNLFMAPGTLSFEELLAPISKGLFVTDLFGHSINGLTGDYSMGARGFWIENGQIAYPVQGVTIAGNLKDMFKGLTPASDLPTLQGNTAPTVRMASMTVAGNG